MKGTQGARTSLFLCSLHTSSYGGALAWAGPLRDNNETYCFQSTNNMSGTHPSLVKRLPPQHRGKLAIQNGVPGFVPPANKAVVVILNPKKIPPDLRAQCPEQEKVAKFFGTRFRLPEQDLDLPVDRFTNEGYTLFPFLGLSVKEIVNKVNNGQKPKVTFGQGCGYLFSLSCSKGWSLVSLVPAMESRIRRTHGNQQLPFADALVVFLYRKSLGLPAFTFHGEESQVIVPTTGGNNVVITDKKGEPLMVEVKGYCDMGLQQVVELQFANKQPGSKKAA